MNFAEGENLILLWILPLTVILLVLGVKASAKRLAKFSHFRLEELLTGRWSRVRAYFKGALLLLALFFLVLVLARPRWGFEWKDVPQGGADIMVALDLSTSMLAADISPSRVERAKREIIDLLNMLEGDRIGIVAFAGVAFVQCPLTVDYRLASLFVTQLGTELMPVQGTAIGDAVKLAVDTLEKASAAASQSKAIILITDGEDQNGNALAAAQMAKEKGIKVYGIGIGSAEGAPIPLATGGFKKDHAGNVIISKLDEKGLKEMVLSTGGTYVRSTTGDLDLDNIYRKGIRASIDDHSYGETRQRVWYERYQWFLLAAFALLLVEFFIQEYKRVVRPRQPKQGSKVLAWFFVFLGIGALGARVPKADASPLKEAEKAFEKADYGKATEGFLKAEIEEPNELKHAYNRAVSQYHQGDYEGAASGFAKSAQSKDKDLSARSYFNEGNALVGKGDLPGAVQAYDQALKINPQDRSSQDNRAWVQKLIEQQKQQQQQQGQKQQQDQKDQHKDGEEKQQQQQQDAKQGQDQKQQGDQQQQQQGQQSQEAGKNPQEGKQGDSQAKDEKGDPKQGDQDKKDAASADKQEKDKDKGQEQGEQKDADQGKSEKQADQNEQKDGADGSDSAAGSEQKQAKQGQEAGKGQGRMSMDEAEKLLRSLEDQDQYYGKPPRMAGPKREPDRDW